MYPTQRERRLHPPLLARLTEFIEVESGRLSRFAEYVQTGGKGYDVEHIWANRWSRHRDEFPQEKQFDNYRNWIGGLVLLPHSTNIALKDKRYAGKQATSRLALVPAPVGGTKKSGMAVTSGRLVARAAGGSPRRGRP